MRHHWKEMCKHSRWQTNNYKRSSVPQNNSDHTTKATTATRRRTFITTSRYKQNNNANNIYEKKTTLWTCLGVASDETWSMNKSARDEYAWNLIRFGRGKHWFVSDKHKHYSYYACTLVETMDLLAESITQMRTIFPKDTQLLSAISTTARQRTPWKSSGISTPGEHGSGSKCVCCVSLDIITAKLRKLEWANMYPVWCSPQSDDQAPMQMAFQIVGAHYRSL